MVAALAFITITPLASAQEFFVSPGSGTARDTFTFSGTGFRPGAALDETYTAPNGDEYTYFLSGQPAVVVVGGDGRFSVDVVPARDFTGAAPGRWTAEFCAEDDTCWVVTFDVRP